MYIKILTDILFISEPRKKGNETENVNGIRHYWSRVSKEDRAKV